MEMVQVTVLKKKNCSIYSHKYKCVCNRQQGACGQKNFGQRILHFLNGGAR